MKLVELKLKNYKSFGSLTLDESELKDFLVFAGRNGTGKTALLEAIAYALKTPNSGPQNGTFTSSYSYVGSASDTGSAYIKVRLNDYEVAFITEKYKELKNTGQIYTSGGEPPKYNDVVSREFESTVIFHHNSAGIQPNNTVSVQATYKSIAATGSALIHPLSILIERQIAQSLIYFNAYRQVDISETQIFSQMPQAPIANQQSLAMQQNTMNSGNQSEHRQTMTFPLLRALNEITLYEAYEELNQKDNQEKLAKKIKPQLGMMNNLIKPKEVLPPRFVMDQNRIEYFVKTAGGEHSISTLSAGENELLILSTYLFKVTEYQKLNTVSPIILIDEPELHLHSLYAERLAQLIKGLDFSKSNCFIASHSPDFIDAFDDSLRKIEDGQVKKIVGLEQRKELFSEIGRKITPAALVEKIVFVEGSNATTKKLHDETIYQRLLDPEIITTLFVSVGDRIQARLAGHVTDEFVEAIKVSSTDNNLFMLTDGDDSVYDYTEPEDDSKVRSLNVYHVENLLLSIDAFVAATSLYGSAKSKTDVSKILKDILKDLVDPTIDSLQNVMRRKEQLKILDQLKEPVLDVVDRKKPELEACETEIEAKLATYRSDLEAAIETDEWRRLFKGADIIKAFNQSLNQSSSKSIGYLDLQNKLLEETTYDKLLPQTQQVLKNFKLE
jgi:AAA15 family ATPase/GTPase